MTDGVFWAAIECCIARYCSIFESVDLGDQHKSFQWSCIPRSSETVLRHPESSLRSKVRKKDKRWSFPISTLCKSNQMTIYWIIGQRLRIHRNSLSTQKIRSYTRPKIIKLLSKEITNMCQSRMRSKDDCDVRKEGPNYHLNPRQSSLKYTQ